MDDSSDISNRTVSGTSSSQIDDMTTVVTSIKSVLPTESFPLTVTQTITESFTIYRDVTVTDLYYILSPSPTQSSDTAGSTSCSSSDTDNRPIYVTVAIVIVGILITITVVIVVGVLLCHRHQKEKDSDRSSVPLNVKYKNANDTNTRKVSIVEVDNDLYGRAIRPKPK